MYLLYMYSVQRKFCVVSTAFVCFVGDDMDSYAIHSLAPPKEVRPQRGKSPLLTLLKRTTSRSHIAPMISDDIEDVETSDQRENGPSKYCTLMPRTAFDFKQGSKTGEHDLGGIVRTRTDKLIVLDPVSRKMKMFKKSSNTTHEFQYRCITTHSFSEHCNSVAAVKDKMIAVTSEKKVEFFRVRRSKLKCSSMTIRTPSKCFAVTATSNKVFFIAQLPSGHGCIKCYERIQSTFTSNWKLDFIIERPFGENLSIHSFLVADEEEDTVYFTNPESRFLASMSFRGEMIRIARFDWTPRGLAVVGDYIIVNNDTSHSLCLMNKNGQLLKYLIRNLHENPSHLCYIPTSKELFVCALRSPKIRVYSVLSSEEAEFSEC